MKFHFTYWKLRKQSLPFETLDKNVTFLNSEGAKQGRTQSFFWGVTPPLRLDILQNLHYLRKGN